jgi:hypothetical protein
MFPRPVWNLADMLGLSIEDTERVIGEFKVMKAEEAERENRRERAMDEGDFADERRKDCAGWRKRG